MDERRRQILYVEDQQDIIDLVRVALRRKPVDVIAANDVIQALKLLQETTPDLVLLDLMMPEVDGWAVYREMRASERLRSVPIIVITARGDLRERDEALHKEGIVGYLIKPFSPTELIRMIDDILNRSPESAGKSH